MTREEAVAKTLFAMIYDGCLDENDPDFPERVWSEMSEDRRATWRRKARVVLAAADAAT